MKKFLLSLMTIMSLVWTNSFAQTPELGTETNPFLIENPDELKDFRDCINSTATVFYFANGTFVPDTAGMGLSEAVQIPRGGEGKYFKLVTDIALNAGNVAAYKGQPVTWEQWIPIGNRVDDSHINSFSGHFDGGGHIVSGLYINSNDPLQGFFGQVTTAEIKNLGITNSYISGSYRVGAICGWAVTARIEECFSTATVVGTAQAGHTGQVGGIAGYVAYSGSVGSTITNCYNTGYVRTESGFCGGIAGELVHSEASNCYNAGVVGGKLSEIGAIAGMYDIPPVNCYYDNQISPLSSGATGDKTAVVARAAYNGLGSAFTYADGYYPRLTVFLSNPEGALASALSAAPVFLPTSSTFDNIVDLDNNNQEVLTQQTAAGGSTITWGSSNSVRASVTGGSTLVRAVGDFTMTAQVGNHARAIYMHSNTGDPVGSEVNPFDVNNASTFLSLVEGINSGGHFALNRDSCTATGGEGMWFVLDGDIDINPDESHEFATWDDDHGPAISWPGMGTPESPFKGHFDGKGHTIAGIYGTGFIGTMTEEASVENVGLIRGYVNNGRGLGYVTDGLIMHYDGIMNTRAGHNANATEWEDLAGNYDMKIMHAKSVTWGEDHILALGDSAFFDTRVTQPFIYRVGQQPNTNSSSGGNNLTVEIVTYMDCDRTTPAYRGLMGSNNNLTASMIRSEVGSERITNLGGLDPSSADDQVITLSFSRGDHGGGYLNGQFKILSSQMKLALGNEYYPLQFGNGTVDWGAPCNGWNDSIYAIRVYRRSLTGQEIARNYALDKARFIDKTGGGYSGTVVSANLGGVVRNCYSTLNVSDGSGLVGFNSGSVENCFYAGTATGRSSAALVGMNSANGSVRNSYSSGSVEGSYAVCGATTHVNNCHYDSQMAPNVTPTAQCSDHTTANMLGNGANALGSAYTYKEGLYPQLSVFNGTAASSVAAIPVLMTGSTYSGDINPVQLAGCDSISWQAYGCYSISGCVATVETYGYAQLEASLDSVPYKTLRMMAGNPKDQPYLIDDLTQLKNFRACINSGTKFYYDPAGHSYSRTPSATHTVVIPALGRDSYFRLTQDIDMDNKNWQYPIGLVSAPFQGDFDGDGHVIRNFYLNASSGGRVNPYNAYYGTNGLFGYSQGTIHDLGMERGSVNNTDAYFVGTLCGVNNGTIYNCYTQDIRHGVTNHSSTSYSNYASGRYHSCLVAANFNGEVRDCYVLRDTLYQQGENTRPGVLCSYNSENLIRCHADSCVLYSSGGHHIRGAGLVCGTSALGSLKSCYSVNGRLISVGGSNYEWIAGGVVGYAIHTDIDSCYSRNVNILGKDDGGNVGGLVGGLTRWCTLTNSWTDGGFVEGRYTVGGLFGYANYSSIISDCYNTADVSGGYTAGGLGYALQYKSRVTRCYNTGNVTAQANFNESANKFYAGLIGYTRSTDNATPAISYCFNTGKVTGTNHTVNTRYVAGVGPAWWEDNAPHVANCFNAGELEGRNSAVFGLTGRECPTRNCYNIGKMTGLHEIYGVSITDVNNASNFNRYYDVQMCPNVTVNRSGVIAKQTENMLGNALQGQLGNDADWVFSDCMYPRIKGLENTDAAIAAAVPVNLVVSPAVDNVNTVANSFTVCNPGDTSVTWEVVVGDSLVEVSGNNYTLNPGARGTIVLDVKRNDTTYKTITLVVMGGALLKFC